MKKHHVLKNRKIPLKVPASDYEIAKNNTHEVVIDMR